MRDFIGSDIFYVLLCMIGIITLSFWQEVTEVKYVIYGLVAIVLGYIIKGTYAYLRRK